MRGLRYDRILAGTALALILSIPAAAYAQRAKVAPKVAPKVIEASVPMPQSDALPPPTSADIAAPAQAAPAATTSEPAAAPAETAAPDPLASLDPADRPIAEKVRDLLDAKTDKIFTDKKQHAAVETFYQNRNFVSIWLDKGVENPRAKAVEVRLKASDADGLDPNDYKLPDLTGSSPDAQAEAELKFTATVLTFARHLQAGRFPFQRISIANIEVAQQPPETADVLTKVIDATDVAAALDTFSPPQPEYKALKAMLAEMRAKANGGAEQIGDGPVLKVQKVAMEDPRVPLLRARFGVAGDASDDHYDAKVADAVKKYQRANDLPVTGTLDARTIKELNGPTRDRQIDIVVANMERWRWYPRDMGGKDHVVVNIPEYQLRLYKDDALYWQTRIVVGQPSKQTPLMTAEMKYITVNPTWNVPQSIINNEYLPALKQDPTVLDRMGLKVTHDRDGSIHISQPPGDGNALGRVRFNFPNKFLVYQHDTPDKYLFAKDERAYSHGCMRVQDPPKYAEMLLSIARPGENWSAERIKKMYGGGEQDIQFQHLIPVNLTYQTAYVQDGKLVIRKDIYGYDSKMISAIKNDRGMIEMAQDRKHYDEGGGGGSSTKRARLPEPQRPVNFFEALFGGGQRAAPPPQPTRRVAR